MQAEGRWFESGRLHQSRRHANTREGEIENTNSVFVAVELTDFCRELQRDHEGFVLSKFRCKSKPRHGSDGWCVALCYVTVGMLLYVVSSKREYLVKLRRVYGGYLGTKSR